jgi:dihydrofolate synthase / folylpolyglutamate synthase
MTYKKAVEYILEQLPMFQRIGKAAYRAGLENTLQLDAYFQHPHHHFKTIHVAGTNGKGSVSHMLASILAESGLKTGLYTSPHLIDFRERIRVNAHMISRDFITRFIKQHRAYFRTFDPSFFEISVFLAFEYFKHQQVDIAVVEVGLGGRLDATNIIHPLVSVITNIGKDHTEILGDTLSKIAMEKAGIIKPGIPVVIGESNQETLPVFKEIASQKQSALIVADEKYSINYSLGSPDGFQVFNVHKEQDVFYANLKCGLNGFYQRKNVVTALSAIDLIRESGIPVHEKDIFAGIRKVVDNTGLSGRWQITGENPKVVCDTAHNADGIKWVVQQITETPFKKLYMVVGFVNDKDIHEMLKFLPVQASYSFVRLSVPRTMDENLLAAEARKHGLKGNAWNHIKEAMEHVHASAAKEDLIVITGSNFLVADYLGYVNFRPGKKKRV